MAWWEILLCIMFGSITLVVVFACAVAIYDILSKAIRTRKALRNLDNSIKGLSRAIENDMKVNEHELYMQELEEIKNANLTAEERWSDEKDNLKDFYYKSKNELESREKENKKERKQNDERN